MPTGMTLDIHIGESPHGFVAFFTPGSAAAGALVAGAMAVVAYLLKVSTEAALGKWSRERRWLEILCGLRSQLRDTIDYYERIYVRSELPDDDPEKPIKKMEQNFIEATRTGRPYIPFITFVTSDLIWDVVRPELTAISGDLLDNISSCYYIEKLISQQAIDFRTDDYKSLPIERQKLPVMSLYATATEFVIVGRKIVDQVNDYEKRFWGNVRSLAALTSLLSALLLIALVFAFS